VADEMASCIGVWSHATVIPLRPRRRQWFLGIYHEEEGPEGRIAS